MFTGIDEVDWASMRHAYGSAEDVPGLLRGLASADPAEREIALDGMYGAVHHQGDVYDSTLACIPYLFALAAREEVRDRGEIVELLVSIGGEGAAPEGVSANYAMAYAAVRAGAEVFVGLTGDPDPGVRRTAADAVVRFLHEPGRVLGLLRERITVERDDRVLIALTESLGLLARRHPGHATDAVDLLTALGMEPYGPSQRLAALGQLAGHAPDRLPADLVPTVLGLLRQRSEQRARPSCEPDRPDTNTLVGRLRRLRPSDEEGSQLLRTLHTALDGRVADRIALLNGQLTSPDPTVRCNAMWMSLGLFLDWRADYSTPVALIGAQLAAEEDQLRYAAISVLDDLHHLAAPAADDLHRLVTARPDLWVQHRQYGGPALGGPLKALARSGDPRAVPVLAELLDTPGTPSDLGHVVGHLGAHADRLAPALRESLARIPLDAPDIHDRAEALLSALGALDDAGSVPLVLRLLTDLPEHRLRSVVVHTALHTLRGFGAAAHEAIPVVRGLLEGESAVEAADALWALTGDADAVLPVLTTRDGGVVAHRDAPEVLGRMGPAAAPAVDRLRRMLDSPHEWQRTAVACALWRIGGEAEAARVLPLLRRTWTETPNLRRPIAECVADLGPAGAPLHDLLRTELASPQRYTAPSGGFGPVAVLSDERLLRICRGVLGVG